MPLTPGNTANGTATVQSTQSIGLATNAAGAAGALASWGFASISKKVSFLSLSLSLSLYFSLYSPASRSIRLTLSSSLSRFRSYHQRNSPHLSNEEFQPLICPPHPFLQLLKLRQVHLHYKFQVDSLLIQVLEVLQRSRRIGEEI